MLQSLHLESFKNFADAQATFAPFTLLVGPNAAGKSNLLDALRILHGIAQGWPIRDVLGGRVQGGTKVWPGIRGGTKEVVRAGQSAFRLQSSWRIGGDMFDHDVVTDGASVLSESIGNLFRAERRPPSDAQGRDLHVEWLPGSMQPGAKQEHSQASTLSSGAAAASYFAGGFAASLRSMRFLDLQPQSMRRYSDKSNTAQLADDGSNLSSVLWSMCKHSEERRREIVDWLVELCATEIVDLEFDETDSGDVLLRAVEADGTRVTARSMSDGTLRFLGLLAALTSLDSCELLVIEDLDHGLHPSRLGLLLSAIESACTKKHQHLWPGASVVATTHSPTLLAAALDDPGAACLLLARPEPDKGTIIRDIRALPHFEDVRKRRDFTYLINTGWLERAL